MRRPLAGIAILLFVQIGLVGQNAAPPAGSLSGRIFDSRGQAVRAGITLYRDGYDAEGNRALVRVPIGSIPYNPVDARLTSYGLANTLLSDPTSVDPSDRPRPTANDLGEFRIRNLEPGEYVVHIDAGARNAFYPGETDPTKATRITVRAGEENALRDMTLNLGAEGVLRVRVMDETGLSLTNALVHVKRSGDSHRLLSQNLAPGRMSDIGRLPLGTYEVEAILVRVTGPISAASATVQMMGADRELDLKVSRGAMLSGRALTLPVDGISKPVDGVRFGLAFSRISPGLVLPVASDANGNFKAESVPPGVSLIVPMGIPGGMCLTGVAQGPRNALREGLEVAGQETRFTALLRTSSEKIAGAVQDGSGKPVPGALVAVVPDDAERKDAFAAASADSRGSFEFECLDPGTYKLYAWNRLDGAAYKNAEFMKMYEGRGVPLAVQTGRNLAVEVRSMDR